jgi:hypothetical protein
MVGAVGACTDHAGPSTIQLVLDTFNTHCAPGNLLAHDHHADSMPHVGFTAHGLIAWSGNT